jgi:hypothetical protein
LVAHDRLGEEAPELDPDCRSYHEIAVDDVTIRVAKDIDWDIADPELCREPDFDLLYWSATDCAKKALRNESQLGHSPLAALVAHLERDHQERENEMAGDPFDVSYHLILMFPRVHTPYAPLLSVLYLKGFDLHGMTYFFARPGLRAIITTFEEGSTLMDSVSLTSYYVP